MLKYISKPVVDDETIRVVVLLAVGETNEIVVADRGLVLAVVTAVAVVVVVTVSKPLGSRFYKLTNLASQVNYTTGLVIFYTIFRHLSEVIVNNVISKSSKVFSGVPQGVSWALLSF